MHPLLETVFTVGSSANYLNVIYAYLKILLKDISLKENKNSLSSLF